MRIFGAENCIEHVVSDILQVQVANRSPEYAEMWVVAAALAFPDATRQDHMIVIISHVPLWRSASSQPQPVVVGARDMATVVRRPRVVGRHTHSNNKKTHTQPWKNNTLRACSSRRGGADALFLMVGPGIARRRPARRFGVAMLNVYV